MACEGCQNLLKEKKEKKHQYGCGPYKNLPEHEKKLIQYRKKYYEICESFM